MKRLATSLFVAVLLLAGILSGCKRQAESDVPNKLPAPTAFTEEARAQLAEADAADGKTDQIVGKCVTCRLQMNGKPEHSMSLEGYTVQLCSASCRQAFEKDPAKALLALKSARR